MIIRNQDLENEKDNTNPTDYMIVDVPPNNLKTSNTSSQVDLISQPFLISPFRNPRGDDLNLA
jgi:hypothetical protein